VRLDDDTTDTIYCGLPKVTNSSYCNLINVGIFAKNAQYGFLMSFFHIVGVDIFTDLVEFLEFSATIPVALLLRAPF